MVGTIIGCVAVIVLYCIYDRRRTNNKEDEKRMRDRLDELEVRLVKQDALMGDLAGHIDDLTESVKEIREDISTVVPVPGQNVI